MGWPLMLGALLVLGAAFLVLAAGGGSPDDDASGGPLGLEVEALNSHSAQLRWRVSPGAGEVTIERREQGQDDGDWREIDRVPARSAAYVDYLLWRGTTYEYRATVATPRAAASKPRSVAIPMPAEGESFPRLYGSASPLNRPIDPAEARYEPDDDPQDLGSRMIEYSFTDAAEDANLVADHEYGQSLVYANPSSPVYTVGCAEPESDECFTEEPVEFRFPAYANLEHEIQNDPSRTVTGARNDGHDQKLTVIEPAIEGDLASGAELGLFQASFEPPPADVWTSDSRSVAPARGSGIVPCQPAAPACTGPTASGFTNMAGVIRPEEVADGEIRHALAIGTPHAHAGLIACPATKANGGEAPEFDPATGEQTTFPIPLGARVQLRPGTPIPSSWPPVVRLAAEALQTYGAFIRDNSGTITIAAENDLGRGYPVWEDDGEQEGKIAHLSENQDRILLDELNPPFPWQQLRVLEIAENTGSPGDCAE